MTFLALPYRETRRLTLLFFVLVPLVTASTIHVPADEPTIQAAIDAASSGDTILVSAGTYKENMNLPGLAWV